jgi:O-acetyl-ADP-ribose deacetylase (regulator of RNase III)
MNMIARLVDITTLRVDAIVNAANKELAAGGGVCGSIHRAAGPELAKACAQVSPCPVGEARITPGFQLPARYVIHTVGPVWRGGGNGEADLLASAYRAAVKLAQREHLSSMAFPAISTGSYKYPLREAAEIAITTVGDELAKGGTIREVIFACRSTDVLHCYVVLGL